MGIFFRGVTAATPRGQANGDTFAGKVKYVAAVEGAGGRQTTPGQEAAADATDRRACMQYPPEKTVPHSRTTQKGGWLFPMTPALVGRRCTGGKRREKTAQSNLHARSVGAPAGWQAGLPMVRCVSPTLRSLTELATTHPPSLIPFTKRFRLVLK